MLTFIVVEIIFFEWKILDGKKLAESSCLCLHYFVHHTCTKKRCILTFYILSRLSQNGKKFLLDKNLHKLSMFVNLSSIILYNAQRFPQSFYLFRCKYQKLILQTFFYFKFLEVFWFKLFYCTKAQNSSKFHQKTVTSKRAL